MGIKVFKDLDTDGSGAVSKDEFLPVFVDKVIRKGFEAMKMQPFVGYELRATKTHRRWRVTVKRVVTDECSKTTGRGNVGAMKPVGLTVTPVPGALLVRGVERGVFMEFNIMFDEYAIRPGDRIVQIGGRSSRDGDVLFQRFHSLEEEV